jgi:hypothetical protein
MDTYNSLILLAMVLFLSCQSTIDNNEEFKSPILEYYIEKYDLNGNPSYISIFSEEQNDSLYRYTWNLDKANMPSHSPILFEEFASEIFIQTEVNDYQLFDVVFDRHGRIHQVGLFDALDRFTGIVYDYDFQQNLILKEAQMRDKDSMRCFTT